MKKAKASNADDPYQWLAFGKAHLDPKVRAVIDAIIKEQGGQIGFNLRRAIGTSAEFNAAFDVAFDSIHAKYEKDPFWDVWAEVEGMIDGLKKSHSNHNKPWRYLGIERPVNESGRCVAPSWIRGLGYFKEAPGPWPTFEEMATRTPRQRKRVYKTPADIQAVSDLLEALDLRGSIRRASSIEKCLDTARRACGAMAIIGRLTPKDREIITILARYPATNPAQAISITELNKIGTCGQKYLQRRLLFYRGKGVIDTAGQNTYILYFLTEYGQLIKSILDDEL